MSRFNTKFLSD